MASGPSEPACLEAGGAIGEEGVTLALADEGGGANPFDAEENARQEYEAPSPTYEASSPYPIRARAKAEETADLTALDSSASQWLKNYTKDARKPTDYLPPFKWLPAYIRVNTGKATEEDLAGYGALPYSIKGDLIAGITVGFMLVPQCLAFALLAGLPVQVGLYASFGPLLVYALTGTIRQVQPGPTALMSLISGQALDAMGLMNDDERVSGAALMAVLVGVVSILLGIAKFGFIVDFMSHSVMSAFCSAAGITIATSQLKYMFGITMERHHYWWQTVGDLIINLPETDFATFMLAWTLLGILLLLKYWKSAGSEDARLAHPMWKRFPTDKTTKVFKAVKLVADVSSVLAVIVGWCWGAIYRAAGVKSVKFVGSIASEGFKFILPGASAGGAFGDYLQAAIIAAVVGFLETMAVGGKFAMQARYDYDSNQELLALGAMNVVGGLMSGYPTTGSFSRTAVNALFGATSLVACAISSLLVLIAALFLLPIVETLPLCSLAPIIIQGAIGVVDFHEFQMAWQASRCEFLVMLSTFVLCLAFGVKYGLAAGFLLSIMKTMYDLSNPNLAVTGRLPNGAFRDIRHFPEAEQLPNAVVVRMDARLTFANSRKMREFCLKVLQVRIKEGSKVTYLIIDGRAINDVDLTGCQMLEVLAESTKTHGVKLVVANLKAPVAKSLVKAGVHQLLKRHGGMVGDFTLDRAIEITQGKQDTRVSKDLRDLISRHETAAIMASSQQSGILASVSSMTKCSRPKDDDPPRLPFATTPSNVPSGTNSLGPSPAAAGGGEAPREPVQDPSTADVVARELVLVEAEPSEQEEATIPVIKTETPPPPPPPPAPPRRATMCSNLTATMFIPCGSTNRVV